jgi:hypothetical protein
MAFATRLAFVAACFAFSIQSTYSFFWEYVMRTARSVDDLTAYAAVPADSVKSSTSALGVESRRSLLL